MADKPLVIVESPAKAKTIGQFLGKNFTVMASVGHVVDLPSSGLCVDVENDFKLTYEVTKRDVVASLKDALKGASDLYLATDEDREGEAIAWHLKEQLKPKVPTKRMVFHEITKKAIEEAVSNPREIDMGLVDAQEDEAAASARLRAAEAGEAFRLEKEARDAVRRPRPASSAGARRWQRPSETRQAGSLDLTGSSQGLPGWRWSECLRLKQPHRMRSTFGVEEDRHSES
jgi:5S rRNA maturation endonuclease (ribonuclease M5)